MKNIILFLSLGLMSFGTYEVVHYLSLPTVKNESFKSGERLRYRVSYGLLDAGEAVLEVKNTSKKGAGRDLLHVKGTGKTLGAFKLFYKVEDTYESYIDKKGIFPWYFVRRVSEGGYKMEQDYAFKQDKRKVDNGEGKEFKVPVGVQDMISSFYYARTLNFDNIKPGKIMEFKCFMDDEVYPLKIKYVGKETVRVRKGKFKCMKFVPVVQEGRYFKNEDDVNFWISDDKNHVPILVKAKIPVGTVRMHLVEWSGLKNDLAKIK